MQCIWNIELTLSTEIIEVGIEIGVSVEYLDYFKSEFRFFKVVNKCQREVSQCLVVLVAFLLPLREHVLQYKSTLQ